VHKSVHDDDLAEDESRESIEIDGVDAPDDDQVARYTEKNESVHATIKQDRGKDVRRKTTETRGGEGTGGNQDQATVELRFFPPIDCQHERNGECSDVEKRNDEKGLHTL